MKCMTTAAKALLVTTMVFAAGTAAGQEWQETKSEAGNFKVLLPGKAQQQSQEIDTAVGKITLHIFFAEKDQGNTAFMVMYNDYPAALLEQKTPDAILDDAANGAVTNVNGKIEKLTTIKLGEHPGRELEAKGESNGQKVFFSWRLYLVGNRLHQVGVLSIDKPVNSGDRKKMFDSFAQLRP